MWLALRFNHWALDCLGDESDMPSLVVRSVKQRQEVIAASPKALKAGVQPGMGLTDARMRLACVRVLQQSTPGETAAMKRLAGWAWNYSDRVHWAVAGPDIECARLIIEIGASLRLFGGRRALLVRIRDDLNRFGYRYQAGVGDSPYAALAFARSRRHRKRGEASGLHALPITCLDLPVGVSSSLAASGLKHTGELLALPPGTLARRYGQSVLSYLERLRGRQPHGLPLYTLPARYTTRYELNGAVETTQGLIFVLRRVFTELAAFLRGADSAIQTLRLTLRHDREPDTRLTLRLSAPSHDAQHLERIAHERLNRLELAAPVIEIALTSDRLRQSTHDQQALWQSTHHKQGGKDHWPAVLDRLRARLGHGGVTWLEARPDHRPECATAIVDRPPAPIPSAARGNPRPLWMLDRPEPIDEDLTWVSGPERIETGWWADGIRRDYYRALDQRGRLLWVFRDLEAASSGQQRYYLHGLFG